jgi:hypothetical protein
MEDPGPLRAGHTPNFPQQLRHLGASLLVTTDQAGKLVMVRDEGDHLNTHFRAFQAPMGLALADGGRAHGQVPRAAPPQGTIRRPLPVSACPAGSSFAFSCYAARIPSTAPEQFLVRAQRQKPRLSGERAWGCRTQSAACRRILIRTRTR